MSKTAKSKTFVREISLHVELHRDKKTGIAMIKDGNTGTGVSCHPSIDSNGSIAGMKDRGYWEKKARTVKAFGFIYNVDSLIVQQEKPFDQIAADECECVSCVEQRDNRRKEQKYEGTVSVCAHQVKFRYWNFETEQTQEVEDELREHAEERAKECITEGYHSGELNCLYRTESGKEEEIRGWWEIE